jgi:RimJ/RimL family protein N-acetyltransferase
MQEEIIIQTRRLSICPVTQRHSKFLLKLWNDPDIMRYAGFARNWSCAQIKEWHRKYKKRLIKYGNTEIQFIHKLRNGRLIGESGIGRLRVGWSCPNYETQKDKLVLMTDVKLAKPFWNKGYGTEAMKAILQYVFTKTSADILLVPPHRDNVPAIKVYEKAGFKKTKGIWYRYHMIYEMTKKDFMAVHGEK